MDRNVFKYTPLSALLNTTVGAGEKRSVITYSWRIHNECGKLRTVLTRSLSLNNSL